MPTGFWTKGELVQFWFHLLLQLRCFPRSHAFFATANRALTLGFSRQRPLMFSRHHLAWEQSNTEHVKAALHAWHCVRWLVDKKRKKMSSDWHNVLLFLAMVEGGRQTGAVISVELPVLTDHSFTSFRLGMSGGQKRRHHACAPLQVPCSHKHCSTS